MEWIPGGTLHDGIGPPLSRGGADARRDGGGLLDRSLAGDERVVPAVRRGDRVRHPGRDRARSRAVPGRGPGAAGAGVGGVRQARRARRPAQPLQLVGLRAGRRLAPPERAGELDRRDGRPPGRPRRVRRRQRVRALGRQGAADRGGVGVRRAGRPGRRRLRLGRQVRTGRQADGQHLAGRVPDREPEARRIRSHVAGRFVPRQRLGPLRHDRQRVGVDDRLVRARARAARRDVRLLQRRRSGGARAQLRSQRVAADSRAR